MKRKYAAIDEKVKIIVPNAFIRVGYPLSVDVLRQTRGDEVEYLVLKAAIAIGAIDPFPERAIDDIIVQRDLTRRLRDSLPSKIYSSLEFAVCSNILHTERWGGKERKVYEEERPHMAGSIGVVTGKRTIKTGGYYGASGGYDSWSGEYDWEPGGLTDMKTHVVYTLDVHDIHLPGALMPWPQYGFQILASNCEVIRNDH